MGFQAVENVKRDPSAPIEVYFDTSELTKLQQLFPALAKAVRSAYIRTLRRATSAGESAAAKIYQSSYKSVTQRLIKDKYIKIRGFFNEDDLEKIGAAVTISGGGVLLEYFKPKRTNSGVSYSASGKTVNIERGFYANVFKKSNKSPHWFRRTKKAVAQGTRFPVEFLWGPSPYTVFKYEKNSDQVAQKMLDTMNAELPRQLSYYMEKATADALKSIANS